MPILIFGSPDSGVSVGVTPAIGSGSALAPVGRQRVFTNTGQIAAGALLRTYMAGAASTPLQTYADEQLSIENPNPIEASASGLFGPIYLIEGQAYYFVLTEADGTPIWEQDNVGDDVQVPAAVTAAIAAAVAAVTTVVPQSSVLVGTQHDVPLTPGATQLRLDNASLLRITGFSAGVAGQRLTVISVGAGQVDFAHENAGSVAANRLHNFATSGDTSLASAVGTAVFEYDASNARWRMVEHEQGAWITPTYAAGDFTASGAMTWTVDAADVGTYAYVLKGRTLHLAFELTPTSVGGVASTSLRIRVPAGFTVAKLVLGMLMYVDGGGGNTLGFVQVTAGVTVIDLFKLSVAAWTLTTNTTSVYGSVDVEVQ